VSLRFRAPLQAVDIKLNKLAVALIPKESFTVSEVGIV
jgi:hypothetical protein